MSFHSAPPPVTHNVKSSCSAVSGDPVGSLFSYLGVHAQHLGEVFLQQLGLTVLWAAWCWGHPGSLGR